MNYMMNASHRYNMMSGKIIGVIIYTLIFAFVVAIILDKKKNKKQNHHYEKTRKASEERFDFTSDRIATLQALHHDIKSYNYGGIFENINEKSIEDTIKKKDSNFDKREFLIWANDIFIRYHNYYDEGDLSNIRKISTIDFYNTTKYQLQKNNYEKRVKKFEKVQVEESKLFNFEIIKDKQIVSILLKARMIEYERDRITRKVINGDDTASNYDTYLIRFTRDINRVTNIHNYKETINCPNCGAGMNIVVSGKCLYCGSLVTINNHGWALADLKKYEVEL